MAGTATEKAKSRVYGETVDGGKTIKSCWTIIGSTDDADALAVLKTAAPSSLEGVALKGWDREWDGDSLWSGTVSYEDKPSGSTNLPPAGTNKFSFDTTGGTQKITVAPLGYVTFGADAPDNGGAINVSRDGDKVHVNGVDVVFPTYKWTETITIHFADAAAFDAYKVFVKVATGKTNVAEFRGFAAGEVLFFGAQGQGELINSDASQDVQVVLHFAQSDNLASTTVAGIAGVTKGGWELIDVIWETGLDGDNVLIPEALGVIVHTIYGEADFDDLVS